MPRSSRSKSHKQSKHSFKEATATATVRDYSDSDEDVKMKRRNDNGSKEERILVRVSKDGLVSGEKRKLVSKDLSSSHGNGEASEEYTTSSKRRKEKSHGGSDRWSGGGSEEKREVIVNIDNKELVKSKDLSKIVGDSKSKSCRRDDGANAKVLVMEEESKGGNGNRSEKRRSDNEPGRKEGYQHKENKESKDKDRKREGYPKQVEDQHSKRERENTVWPIEEELRNPELEKELEKRIKKRDGSSDKDKFHDDLKEGDNNRRLSSRNERSRDVKHKDDKYREDGERNRHREYKYREDGKSDKSDNRRKDNKYLEDGKRDKNENRRKEDNYREEGKSDSRRKDDKYREEGKSDNRHKDEKYREDGDRDRRRHEKYMEEEKRDELRRIEKHKQDNDRDYRHKEEKHLEDFNRERRLRDDIEREKRVRDSKAFRDAKANNRDGSPVYDDRVAKYKDDKDDYRSRSNKEKPSESEKRSMSGAKADSVSERGRPSSRNMDMEFVGSHSRRRSSPSESSYPVRDHYRALKQEESKYMDYGYEERVRHDAHSSRDFNSSKDSSWAPDKITQKNDNFDSSVERRLKSDPRSSPLLDKSPSSASNERHLQEIDGGNLSISSPYTRIAQFSGNSKSLLPPTPQFRRQSDSPSAFGSSEDKSNNRHPNMIKAQGNWKNVPNWPTPLANGGFMPFQHVPAPMFHPIMQQYPPPMFTRPHNGMLPYHLQDADRFSGHDRPVPPPLHGYGDESQAYRRVDWDHGQNPLNNLVWESNASPKDNNYSAHGPNVQKLDVQSETLTSSALETNTHEVLKVTESPQIWEDAKEDEAETPFYRVYLSNIDISEDLTQPELYQECRSMMDLDQGAISDEYGCKILVLEDGGETNIMENDSLFTAPNDSVFQKAVSLYKKQKEELCAMNGEKVSSSIAKSGSNDDDKPVEEEAVEDAVMEVLKENEEPILTFVDHPVVDQDEKPNFTSENSSAPEESSINGVKDFNNNNGGSLLTFSEKSTSTEAAMPPESNEIGSVNLSRIHH